MSPGMGGVTESSQASDTCADTACLSQCRWGSRQFGSEILLELCSRSLSWAPTKGSRAIAHTVTCRRVVERKWLILPKPCGKGLP